MATTAKGTPYVVSTDLVANYPTVSSDLADHIDDNLAYNAVTINAQTGTTYTFALADASEGKLVTASNAAASTYTVPPQSSVTWANGAVLRILNQGAGVVTIAAGSGVTINGTPLTLAQYKGAAIQRTASNTWTFVPFSGGVGSAAISNTPTGSYTGYQYWTYTASGTLTVTTAGFADVLVIGGGAGGGCRRGGGGGAGGYLEVTNAYLPAGSLTVTVGAGGTGAANEPDPGKQGSASRVGSYYGIGGGGGGPGASPLNGIDGGSGGGGSSGPGTSTGGAGVPSQGNNGGTGAYTGPNYGAGGGGGASANGGNGTGSAAGAGGAGSSNSYTGSAVSRGGGGGGGALTSGAGAGGTGGGGAGGTGGAGTAGTANTGGGGGGGGDGGTNAHDGGNGGSGIVIIRVAV